jgi:putative transposase
MEDELTEHLGYEKHDQGEKPQTNRRNGKSVKVASSGRGPMLVKKSVYLALAIRLDGQKELLGLWIKQNEGAKFWTGIMNELKTRGVKDILLAAVDGLTGFPDAIAAVWDTAYPMIAKSWRSRRNEVIPFFKFFPEIRKAVCTANAIESDNYTIQKVVKHRQPFPNDGTALKLLFMGLKNIAKKWTMPSRD